MCIYLYYIIRIIVYLHRGHQPVSKGEVLEMYGGTHVPMRITEPSPSYQDWQMVQFLDLFSIPEATLFADVMEVRVQPGPTPSGGGSVLPTERGSLFH